jgi:KUP system potassium uptake protein
MVSVKYMFIVLSADDDGKLIESSGFLFALRAPTNMLISGEGGTFALYSLLAKYSNIVRRDPNVAGTVKMERHLTNDLKPLNKGVRSLIEKSVVERIALKMFGVLGVSMVMVSLLQIPLNAMLTSWVLGRWCLDSGAICSWCHSRY